MLSLDLIGQNFQMNTVHVLAIFLKAVKLTKGKNITDETNYLGQGLDKVSFTDMARTDHMV